MDKTERAAIEKVMESAEYYVCEVFRMAYLYSTGTEVHLQSQNVKSAREKLLDAIEVVRK